MFPRWSDWNIQYSSKGLIKQRIKQTVWTLLLAVGIMGGYYIRKDVRGGLILFHSLIRQNMKFGLLSFLTKIVDVVRRLPEHGRIW